MEKKTLIYIIIPHLWRLEVTVNKERNLTTFYLNQSLLRKE
jgi:hypothetical protein